MLDERIVAEELTVNSVAIGAPVAPQLMAGPQRQTAAPAPATESDGKGAALANQSLANQWSGAVYNYSSNARPEDGMYEAVARAGQGEKSVSFAGSPDDVRRIQERLGAGESLDAVVSDIQGGKGLNVALAMAGDGSVSSAQTDGTGSAVASARNTSGAIASSYDHSNSSATAQDFSAATSIARTHSTAESRAEKNSFFTSSASDNSTAIGSAFNGPQATLLAQNHDVQRAHLSNAIQN